jgi:TRAP transporter TAXI family solute receptor
MSEYILGERWRRNWLWATALALAAVVLGLSLWLVGPAPPKRILLATGQANGSYDRFGNRYQCKLRRLGLKVDLVHTNGSVDNLQRLLRGEVDVAFMQGGTEHFVDDPHHLLRGLATIYIEPLWVFCRGTPSPRSLSDLQGRSISIGPVRSGTEAVGARLLEAHGVNADNSRLVHLSTEEVERQLGEGKLDAAMLVASCGSPSVQRLLRRKDLTLMDFAQQNLAHARLFSYLRPVQIYEGLFDLKDDIPGRDLTLLAPAAILACRSDLHPRVVEQLLKTARSIHSRGDLLSDAGRFPTLNGVTLPLHETAETYMTSGESYVSRLLPYWAVRWLWRLQILVLPLLAVWYPFFKVVPAIYHYRVNRLLRQHYAALREAERTIARATTAAELKRRLDLLEELRTAMESFSRKVPAHLQGEVYQWRLHVSLVHSEALDRLRRMSSPGESFRSSRSDPESLAVSSPSGRGLAGIIHDPIVTRSVSEGG